MVQMKCSRCDDW